MTWIIKNNYLSLAEMTNNAQQFVYDMSAYGWSKNALAAILGNMQSESNINPGIWENLTVNYERGYGLVQWTPATKYIDWAGANWNTGERQVERINYEADNGIQWFENPEVSPSVPPISFAQFRTSELPVATLANYFLWYYEHPAVPYQPIRAEQAQYWFDTLDFSGSCTIYTSRLTDSGIRGNKFWYSENPFYQSGFGMPNCTAYAWGRFWELNEEYLGNGKPSLGLGNADTWYAHTQDGYSRGSSPKLGALICFGYRGSLTGQGGHVAVVEEIHDDGSITTSNSAWGGSFFYTQVLTPPDYTWTPEAYVQGFIYSPTVFCQNGKPGSPGYIPGWPVGKHIQLGAMQKGGSYDRKRFIKTCRRWI